MGKIIAHTLQEPGTVGLFMNSNPLATSKTDPSALQRGDEA